MASTFTLQYKRVACEKVAERISVDKQVLKSDIIPTLREIFSRSPFIQIIVLIRVHEFYKRSARMKRLHIHSAGDSCASAGTK